MLMLISDRRWRSKSGRSCCCENARPQTRQVCGDARNRLLSQCGIAAVKQPLFNPTPWMRVTAMEEERETDVQPGEEHKRERMMFARKQKDAGTEGARTRQGRERGGFRLIVVCCFNGLEAKSRTNAIRRRALGQEHQQQSSTKNQAVPAEPSGRIPGTESTPQAQRQHKSLPDPKTTLRPSFALAQSIRGRPSRAITPQPTFISRRSPAHQPPIRSPSHFKHASCHS